MPMTRDKLQIQHRTRRCYRLYPCSKDCGHEFREVPHQELEHHPPMRLQCREEEVRLSSAKQQQLNLVVLPIFYRYSSPLHWPFPQEALRTGSFPRGLDLGWACGLHADYTESIVSGCVDYMMNRREGEHRDRRYYLTTFLREPVERFVSEYSHVQRGATWSASRHLCNGRYPSPDELPMCFDPEEGWTGVDLDEFLSCPFNLAFNRQTRMLADLTLVNCYDLTSMESAKKEKVMLESAKINLKSMAFFGVKEKMDESQELFEKLFSHRFIGSLAEWNKSKSTVEHVNDEQMATIRRRNSLDIELYSFAIKLFKKRLALIAKLEGSS